MGRGGFDTGLGCLLDLRWATRTDKLGFDGNLSWERGSFVGRKRAGRDAGGTGSGRHLTYGLI
jgi:hypothetical protein